MNSIEAKVRISELEEENQLLRDRVTILKEEASDAESTDSEFERVEKELTEAMEKIAAFDETLDAYSCPDCGELDALLDLADDLVKIFGQVPHDKLVAFSLHHKIDLVGTLDALELILKGR